MDGPLTYTLLALAMLAWLIWPVQA